MMEIKAIKMFLVVQFMLVLTRTTGTYTYNRKAPRIVGESKGSIALVGAIGFLECNARGRPKPSRSWERDGQSVESISQRYKVNKKTRSLRIFEARIEDTGNYTCIAKNRYGQASMSVPLTVIKKPALTVHPETSLGVEEGADQDIVCRSSAFPKPSFSWITSRDVRLKPRPGTPRRGSGDRSLSRFRVAERVISDTVSESVLSISPVSHQDHGVFVCFAGNEGGSSKAEIEVNVQYSPKPLADEPTRQKVHYYHTDYAAPPSVSCAATGNELPEIQWVYNGSLLNTSHCQVVQRPPEIHSFVCTVTESTMGIYRCYAENSHGRVLIKELDITPLYPPPKLRVIIGRVHANHVKVAAQLGIPNTPDPNYVVVLYRLIKDGKPSFRQQDVYETTADLNSKGEASVVLPGLKENASYLVSVASKNEVGLGPEVTVSIQTGKSESLLDDLVKLVAISGNSLVLRTSGQENTTKYGRSGAENEQIDHRGIVQNEAFNRNTVKASNESMEVWTIENKRTNNFNGTEKGSDDFSNEEGTAYSVLGRSGSTRIRLMNSSILLFGANMVFIRWIAKSVLVL